MGGIACPFQRLDHLGQAIRRIDFDLHRLGHEIHARVLNPGQFRKRALDPPDAGRA